MVTEKQNSICKINRREPHVRTLYAKQIHDIVTINRQFHTISSSINRVYNMRYMILDQILKPVFHCHQCKTTHVGASHWSSPATRASIMPNASQKCPTRAYNAQSEPKRRPVEYGLRWVRESLVCVGHVHLIFFGVNFT